MMSIRGDILGFAMRIMSLINIVFFLLNTQMAYSRNANSLQVLSDVDPVLNFFSLENNLFLVNARDIFFYKKIGTVNGIQYFVFFEKKPSNVDTPEGFCGSGNEIWLNLYKVGEKASTFIDQVLISSCKESFSMDSLESGAGNSESDYSSFSWNSLGFNIKWFSKYDQKGMVVDSTNYIIESEGLSKKDILRPMIYER